LPELDVKRRNAIVWDRVADMAPIVGKTGKEYERTLLVSVIGPINSMRFLADVLREAETDKARQAFLGKVKDRFDGLFNRLVRLLEQDYFCWAVVDSSPRDA
jgi:nicotinamide riboside kinase